MNIKLVRNSNNEKQLLEITTLQSKVAVCFGEDVGVGEILENANPMIDGLTIGKPDYDCIFVMRNPENCNILNYVLDEIPIYLEQKIKKSYDICTDFMKMKKKSNVKEMLPFVRMNDLQITNFLIDNSNPNTLFLLIKAENESVLISGDLRNFNIEENREKLTKCLELIESNVDYWIIDGNFIGKVEPNALSENEISVKLKNVMDFYKQVFVIQSETDLMMTKRLYDIAQKTKKILIEDVFVANLTSEITGSAPNPMSKKNVYTYIPLVMDNRDFEFKRKYISHFYIHNAEKYMKKEKYVININTDMIQDLQVFKKKNVMYDACLILAMNKKVLKINKELEDFINLISEFKLDYYEIYTSGRVNYDLINQIAYNIKPKKIIPLNFNPNDKNIYNKIYDLKVLSDNEEFEV